MELQMLVWFRMGWNMIVLFLAVTVCYSNAKPSLMYSSSTTLVFV